MKLENNINDSNYIIRSYDADGIKVNDVIITTSFIIMPNQLIRNWRPKTYSDITTDDLDLVLELDPEIIILGSGEKSFFPDAKLIASIHSRNIGFEIMDTFAACRSYSILVSEGRKVAAALIKACP